MGISVKYISYYLPERKLTNEELNNEFPDWSVDKISNKIGISNRFISGENEFVSDLAVKAACKLFANYKFSKYDIDYVLLCTQSPDYFLPTTACLVQEKLGLKENTGAMDFNLGCSGYIYGLGIAKGLISTKQAENILLITADVYTKHLSKLDKSNRSIFGDGATASLITTYDECNMDYFDYGTDGKGANNLIVTNGAMKYARDNSDNDYLIMNGAEIFSFTLNKVPALVNNILKKSGCEIDDIDLFVFHQANKFMLENLRKKLKIDENKFFYFLDNVGNTVSSTIPIALSEAIIQKKIQKNNKVMLVGFGVGYSWGGCILQY